MASATALTTEAASAPVHAQNQQLHVLHTHFRVDGKPRKSPPAPTQAWIAKVALAAGS